MMNNILAFVLIILILLNTYTFFIFGHLFVNLWDDAMNNILIIRSDFDAMVFRGFFFFCNTIMTVFIFGYLFGKHRLNGELR